MGVVTYESENAVAVAPSKLFKAYVLDGVNFFPTVIPAIKRIEILEGDGGAGTIKKITFAGADNQATYVKHEIELVDRDTLSYNYSIIEGDVLRGALEKINSKNKIVASADGGSIWKTTTTYHIKGDIVIPEDKLNEAKEKATAMFKVVEAYLLANPDAY
ncbi:stress and pathogenesis-related protein [Tripterygium wilfordii]|uniref:Stress and pathogenesis-related protein n=1 Tax=Tripterygium wilfordii TaxID=458696 RepID=A0A7J7DGR4_TRIWF|nr:major allergen Pru ar 1-like [Tripterygium wilfordii]KAF5745468.1 stress and pathogenesis-related protein [Tripterygium wilfordii]